MLFLECLSHFSNNQPIISGMDFDVRKVANSQSSSCVATFRKVSEHEVHLLGSVDGSKLAETIYPKFLESDLHTPHPQAGET
jgi:hypothetical protein